MVQTWNPKAEMAETSRGSLDSQVNYLVSSRTVKDCLKKKGRIPGILSFFSDKLFSELHSTDILKPHLNIGNTSIEGI